MKSSSGQLWQLCVLALLREREMHPYEMQRVMRERHNNDFLELKRGSLYHAIGKLVERQHIADVETTREGNRPERTVYRITESGERELEESLSQLLATPSHDSIPFIAALSLLGQLDPQDVQQQLKLRIHQLENSLVAQQAILDAMLPKIGRLPMIETEYVMAMQRAERDWIQNLLSDLREGRFTWNTEQLLEWVRQAFENSQKSDSRES